MSGLRVLRTGIAPAALMAGVFALSAGCGGGGPSYANVSGKVTYKGKPVTAGSVYFQSVANPNWSGSAQLTGDGTFTGQAPVGRMKVAVQTEAFKPKKPGGGGPAGGGIPPGMGGRPPGRAGGPPGPGGGAPAWAAGGPGGPGGPGGGSNEKTPNLDMLTKTGSGGAGDPKAAPPKYVEIPGKYESIEKTDIEIEIKSGDNAIPPIELK